MSEHTYANHMTCRLFPTDIEWLESLANQEAVKHEHRPGRGRVIHTDEELMITKMVCRVLGLG